MRTHRHAQILRAITAVLSLQTDTEIFPQGAFTKKSPSRAGGGSSSAAATSRTCRRLGRLLELEPAQAELLERICSGPTITAEELRAKDALAVPAAWRRKLTLDSSSLLFKEEEPRP
jgi:hypothetical protein